MVQKYHMILKEFSFYECEYKDIIIFRDRSHRIFQD
jgi:hypothetical protein